ncbi:MAG: transposase [Bacteroidota bacterium]
MPLPPALAAVMVAFRPLFDKRVFERALVLTAGALLAVRTRTITAALRVTGRDDARLGRGPAKPTDRARQALLQLARWLPERRVVVVADSGFAAIDLLAAVRDRVTVVTRLRLDAALYDPAPPRRPGQVGRPRKRGARQPTLTVRAAHPATAWMRVAVSRWYGQTERVVEIATGTALWYHAGKLGIPLRWVLVRIPGSTEAPKGFLCTDVDVHPLTVVGWYVRRWSVEVTLAEVRRHLGVETQRQWSDLAITRTTPCLLGLFSVVALAADALDRDGSLEARQSAWYVKSSPSFSDTLAAVRVSLWQAQGLSMSRAGPGTVKIPEAVLWQLMSTLAYAA